MDFTLRRKDVWVVGSVCLLSSSVLWRLIRFVMTRGGHWQAPALEDVQVVKSVCSETDSFCLNVSNLGVALAKENGMHALAESLPRTLALGAVGVIIVACGTFQPFKHLHQLLGNLTGRDSLCILKLGICFCLSELKIMSVSLHSPTSYMTYEKKIKHKQKCFYSY